MICLKMMDIECFHAVYMFKTLQKFVKRTNRLKYLTKKIKMLLSSQKTREERTCEERHHEELDLKGTGHQILIMHQAALHDCLLG